MRVPALIAILVMPAAGAADAPQQFDLVCTGTTEQTTVGEPKRHEPFNATFHIDLEGKKWCTGGCGAIYDIYSVQPATIELKEPKHVERPTFPLSLAGDEIDTSFISRTTGEYHALFSTGQGRNILMRVTKGSCERRPFSGFPEIKTKF
jgi:hypothetical protein